MRTHEIMTPNPIVVTRHTSLGECAGKMLKHGIRHLPVVDDTHKATHILTDVAVFQFGGLAGEEMNQWIPFHSGAVPNEANDTSEPIEVVADADDEATLTLQRLVAADQDFALVKDQNGLLLGIVTEHDGLRIAAEILEASELAVHQEFTTPAIIGRFEDSGHEMLVRLQELHFRHVAVVDNSGIVRGVVTVGDLLADNVVHDKSLTVKDVMRPGKVRTIGGQVRLVEAAQRMLTEHIGCLPVVDSDGRPRGILTRTDLIEAAVAALQEQDAFPSV